jgi:hypothetical protein
MSGCALRVFEQLGLLQSILNVSEVVSSVLMKDENGYVGLQGDILVNVQAKYALPSCLNLNI